MAITRLGGANAITGTIPTSVGGTGSTAATLPASLINNTSIGNVTALPAAITTGKVLQVVQDEYPTEQSTTSTSYVDIGGLSVSITPSSTSSKIFVIATLTSCRVARNSATGCDGFYKLVRGSTELTHSGLAYYDAEDNTNRELDGTITLSYLDSPNSTSAQTYKCQMKSSSSSVTTYVNKPQSSNSAMSAITVMEIAG